MHIKIKTSHGEPGVHNVSLFIYYLFILLLLLFQNNLWLVLWQSATKGSSYLFYTSKITEYHSFLTAENHSILTAENHSFLTGKGQGKGQENRILKTAANETSSKFFSRQPASSQQPQPRASVTPAARTAHSAHPTGGYDFTRFLGATLTIIRVG